MPGHEWYKCKKDHQDDYSTCMFCEGGLAWCIICGAFEGQLLTHCPRYMLSNETLDACYQGNVIDFSKMQIWVNNGYNIKKKSWK